MTHNVCSASAREEVLQAKSSAAASLLGFTTPTTYAVQPRIDACPLKRGEGAYAGPLLEVCFTFILLLILFVIAIVTPAAAVCVTMLVLAHLPGLSASLLGLRCCLALRLPRLPLRFSAQRLWAAVAASALAAAVPGSHGP